MEIIIDLKKSLEENASDYFDLAKKIKKKIEGAKRAIEIAERRLEKNKKAAATPILIKKRKRKVEWFEKFRWFISSDGFLCIGGRDATTNDIIIKKYTEKNDLVLHTDMAGSPFVVIKSDSKEIPNTTINEAAEFTATFSRAWKHGYSSLEVFFVKPEQVTKEAKAGEYLTKGAFLIKGKTNYLKPRLNLAIGIYGEKIMAGPISAIKKHCKEYVEILQGNEKTSTIAKQIQKIMGGDLDEIVRAIPAGGCKIKK